MSGNGVTAVSKVMGVALDCGFGDGVYMGELYGATG
jgi:hypothetical protein